MRKEKQEKLLKKLLILNVSTSWYQSQMRVVLAKISEIEDGNTWDDSLSEQYYELQGKLSYLLGKGLFEKKLQKQIELEIKKSD